MFALQIITEFDNNLKKIRNNKRNLEKNCYL